MNDTPIVMVSSTTIDLPEYRGQVRDACLRAGMLPKMMEHLSAVDADAIQVSQRLVDEADVYIGIFAHRYGYIPPGSDISITQMEYERAVERDIPRLIFLMHEDVRVLPKDVDKGEKGDKLDRLKERLKRDRVAGFFKNAEDLRGLVADSLGAIGEQLRAARAHEVGQPSASALARSLHYVSEIPLPPEPYIAHPYTLLQVRSLVGRKTELEMLTDWVTGDPRYVDVRIFSVVAIGGMGKSALTWTWFNDVAPQEMTPLAGRLWWSFYESDATFENFVTRALAYVSRTSLQEVRKLSLSEREDRLLHILDREPFLLALDGLERILSAYGRLDAVYLRDEDAFDEDSAAGALHFQKSARQTFVGKHRLRMTADPRAGRFLRELARVGASRILISTRLYPADLQAPGGGPSPRCEAMLLQGLSDQDALALWREFGARGSRETMLPVFYTFDKHPLLIQLLATEVAEFREMPGDFDAWKAANPGFNPFELEIANVHSHVLLHAMRGLSAAELRTLHIIAGFRMPASMDTLKALLIRRRTGENERQKPFLTLGDLDHALTTLEDRGLLGWDRRANRYDLHPIVRGVIWTGLDPDTRTDIYGTLRTHFEAMPAVGNYTDVESLDDLTPAIELYNTLIELAFYDEAFDVFRHRLDDATNYRLSASHLRVELLERLLPDGSEASRLTSPGAQSFMLNALAAGYHFRGQPAAAISLLRSADDIDVQLGDQEDRCVGLGNLSEVLRVSGHLRGAETTARTSLAIARGQDLLFSEGSSSLKPLGLVLAARGEARAASTALRRSTRIARAASHLQSEGLAIALLAEVALCECDVVAARALSDRAWDLAAVRRGERDFIRAARLQGTTALMLTDFATSGERLHHALLRARASLVVEQELPTLIALAEWHRQQDGVAQARAMLDDVWDAAERGPYPLFHADGLNVLAQIERDAGNSEAAVEAATKAYRLAWCDGPPFAYHWGLEKAKAHLAALAAPEPEMPPFDETKFEPMPEVEINPRDEFYVDESETEL